MKISNLTIKNYKQFKDLSLELTYPKGHEKEGLPLDKICIIGQSGTGKTNLLNIIKKSTIDFSQNLEYRPFKKFSGEETDDRFIQSDFFTKAGVNIKTLFIKDTSEIEYLKVKDVLVQEHEKNYFLGTKEYSKISENEDISSSKHIEKRISNSDKVLLDKLTNAKIELTLEEIKNDSVIDQIKALARIEKDSVIDQKEASIINAINPDRKEKNYSQKLRNINSAINQLEAKYIKEPNIDTSIIKLKKQNFIAKHIININSEDTISWKLLKNKIDTYQDEYTKYNNKLTNKLIEDEHYSKDNYIKDIQDWKDKNANTLEAISDKLNYILKKFNLELTKIDENQKNFTDLIIKDLSNDNIIDYDDLSTGTKNLLSTFIPLKIYEPKDSIILIDEPEMSFYPDIQKELISLYTDIGENNQLIVATHSPIIASSFEPWEIVELKFDENNQIYREKYYEDENHIDNYTLDPRMLTWTGILTDIFDLKEDSNFSVREKALMEYATLKSEIKIIEDIKEKEIKFKELQKLSKKLGLDS